MVCSRCKKKPAVVFVTRMEGDKTINEGFCLTCAREIGLKPVNDMFEKFGLTDEDAAHMDEQIAGLMAMDPTSTELADDGFSPGGAPTFPFLQNLFGDRTAQEDDEDEDEEEDTPPPFPGMRSRKKPSYLSLYCDNLTLKARGGDIDPVIGRDREIYRVVQILSRRTKNNPCLIGEPGVGKTAIAEGLALRIANNDVPARLFDKEVHLLDLTALVAGTQFRGQFESRIKGLVNEVKRKGNIILFIDEVHNLVGAGEAEGTMSAANILKPALSRGEIQVIGATTFNEYRKHIEKDSALERRFQPVTVEEPTVQQAVTMLRGLKPHYEQFHGVHIDDALLPRAVSLAERYITDRYLPDKAIDLLDEACAAASLRNKAANEYDRILREVTHLKAIEAEQVADDKLDFEELAKTRTELYRLQEQADALVEEAYNGVVTADDLARVVELWTGIPAAKIQENELAKLAHLEDHMKQKIIGQDEAVALVAAAVRRSRVQVSPRRRPASFIFVGSTGVGKTELVKVLAAELFDTPETLIRLDMSEFMEKHAVSRIIGSPPGYVGYEEAGQLTEKVRRKPYSVLLFDEIEKAHPDVLNILLQILDEGRVTDAQGRVVNFENTVIVMTSNAGSQNNENILGFGKTDEQGSRDRALKALAEFLRPEFIGRVDEVVFFRPLSLADFERIAGLMLEELVEPLHDRGVTFSWTPEAQQVLAAKAHGGKRGARDLRNVIRREVEDRIASLIVENCDNPPTVVRLTADAAGLHLESM